MPSCSPYVSANGIVSQNQEGDEQDDSLQYSTQNYQFERNTRAHTARLMINTINEEEEYYRKQRAAQYSLE